MTTRPDVLIVDTIGGDFTGKTASTQPLGGSELEIVQVAEALTRRGFDVMVANGTALGYPAASHVEHAGVRYVPRALAVSPSRALYLQRSSQAPSGISAPRTVIRANDVYHATYDANLRLDGALLVANTCWQADGFPIDDKRKAVIPPMLGEVPLVEKTPGLFVYASGAAKGFEKTVYWWLRLKERYPETMRGKRLGIVGCGWGNVSTVCRLPDSVFHIEANSPAEYRAAIARAEGLFYVNVMPETFCCAAAIAERAGTRTHILCLHGVGGIPEALKTANLVTEDEEQFERDFLVAAGQPPVYVKTADLSPDAVVDEWIDVLGLDKQVPTAPAEASLPTETLAKNAQPMPAFFGAWLGLLRKSIAPGGSELALGVNLFNLVVSLRAGVCLEIGRFKGFSTLALAAGLAFCDEGWQEPRAAEQRPDVDYKKHAGAKKRLVLSVDPAPLPEAAALLEEAGLTRYVRFIDAASDKVELRGHEEIDLLFIDGDHTRGGVTRDYERFSPLVREGGYIVFHDMFGWYDADGRNGSPIKQAVDEIPGEKLLVDTGYASLTILRKQATAATATTAAQTTQATPVAPRADGQPTIGALIIARDENPIIARAIQSCRIFDCVTVIVDSRSHDGTRELAQALGAEVHVRESPKTGWLAAVRNDALRIAEQRTDYVAVLDADDAFEGERPVDLTLDLYFMKVDEGGGASHKRPHILRSKRGFRWQGCDKGCDWDVCHEYIVGIGTPEGFLPGLVYKRLGAVKGVSGAQDVEGAKKKYLRHARALQHHHLDHPECTRTVFYIGQSYCDAGDPKEGREWYRKRLRMQPADGYCYLAAIRIADITRFLGEDPVADLLTAHGLDAGRAEPLHRLANYYRDDARRQFQLAYSFAKQAAALPKPDEKLFIEDSVYEWRALEELGLAAHFTGRKEEAIAVAQRLQALVPEWARPWALTFLAQAERGV